MKKLGRLIFLLAAFVCMASALLFIFIHPDGNRSVAADDQKLSDAISSLGYGETINIQKADCECLFDEIRRLSVVDGWGAPLKGVVRLGGKLYVAHSVSNGCILEPYRSGRYYLSLSDASSNNADVLILKKLRDN